MRKFSIRKLGESEWSDTYGTDIYEAAEQFVQEYDEDENPNLWDEGVVYEICQQEPSESKVHKVKVTAYARYDANDFEESEEEE